MGFRREPLVETSRQSLSLTEKLDGAALSYTDARRNARALHACMIHYKLNTKDVIQFQHIIIIEARSGLLPRVLETKRLSCRGRRFEGE